MTPHADRMLCRKALMVLCVSAFICTAQQYSISGLVIDSATGTPLNGVDVRLLRRNLRDVTGADGLFCFGAVGVIPRAPVASVNAPFVAKNGLLTLTLSKKELVSIQTYSISGKMVASLQGEWQAGTYTLRSSTRSPGVYVYRIRTGNDLYTRKFVTMNDGRANDMGGFRLKEPGTAQALLAKSAAAAAYGDSLHFARSGYYPAGVAVTADTVNMTVPMRRVSLPGGVRPGTWNGFTDQRQTFTLNVSSDGKTVDSMTINVRLHCPESGTPLHVFTMVGPFTIPDDGVVTIGDSITLSFSDTTVTGSFSLNGPYHGEYSEGCTRQECTYYVGSGWQCVTVSAHYPLLSLSNPVTFSSESFQLQVNTVNGSVTVSPSYPYYLPGEQVRLIAVPDSNHHFAAGWSGDTLRTSGDTAWVVMYSSKTVTAAFEFNFILTIYTANGGVARIPDRPTYAPGTSVKLIAVPDSLHHFSAWSGDTVRTSGDSAWVIMNSSKTVTADFADNFILTINAADGSVVKSPNKATYAPGSTVLLTAVPDSMHHFSAWSGDLADTSGNTAHVFMDSSKTITAHFADNYLLALTAVNGSISRTPARPSYAPGDTVRLRASPNSLYRFTGWSGDTVWTSGDTSWVVMDGDKAVTASFGPIYLLTVNAVNGSVTRTPNKSYYIPGDNDTVMLVAVPAAGFRLVCWSGNTWRTANDTAWVIMDASKTIVARFLSSTCIRILSGFSDWVTNVSFSPDGSRMLLRSRTEYAKIWETNSDTAIKSFYVGMRPSYSPDGKTILSYSYYSARLRDTSTGQLIKSFTQISFIKSVVFSPDGATILAGLVNRAAILWDTTDTATIIRTFSGHTSSVDNAIFSPDGSTILTDSYDNTAKLWETSTGTCLQTLTARKNPIFSPDGTMIVSLSGYSALLWPKNSDTQTRTFSGHTGTVNAAAFSPDGLKVLTGSEDGTAILWETATGTVIRTFTGHTGGVRSVAFSPDGLKVLTGSADSTAILWNVN
jgi:WD40 repeat protein